MESVELVRSSDRGDEVTNFVKHDGTGRILYTGHVPDSMLKLQGDNVVAASANVKTDYILNGAVTPRPTNPTTLSGMKLLNVPNPSTVTIAGVNPQTVTDGEVDLEFTQPGTYTIVVSSWPALDATFTVTQS
jgi:hypothetical protein